MEGIHVAVNKPSCFCPLNHKKAVVAKATATDSKIHISDILIISDPFLNL